MPPEAGNRGDPRPRQPHPHPPPIQDQLSPWGARGGGRWAAGPGARAMAGGDGGRPEGRQGWGGRRGAGGADEPRTAPELERAAGGGRAGARRSGAGAGAGGGGAAGTERPASGRGGLRGGGAGLGLVPRRVRLCWRLQPRARGAGSARGGGCGGAGAPGGAGTCGGGETEPRRVRGKAVLILTPNVFGESCRRGTLEGGRRGGDRQTHGGGW